MGNPWDHTRKGWPDKPAVVIASGPSLSEADVALVKRARDEDAIRVVAVSNAYKLAPWADAFIAADRRWWKQYLRDMQACGVPKERMVTICSQTADLDKVKRIRAANRPGLGIHELHTGGNSGFLGLNLAFAYGAKLILLLGFDMQFGEKGKKHFDGDHPAPLVQAMPFAEWLKRFESAVPDLRRHGVSVVNCTRSTALRCFPMSTIDAELGKLLPTWAQRVEQEKAELDARLAKLEAFEAAGGFAQVVGAQRALLADQLDVMRKYSDILRMRIDLARAS